MFVAACSCNTPDIIEDTEEEVKITWSFRAIPVTEVEPLEEVVVTQKTGTPVEETTVPVIEPDVVVETPDITAPTVVSTEPSDNETNVDINSAIQVKFSESMDISSFTNESFTFTRGSLTDTWVMSCVGDTVTFTPDRTMASGVRYIVTITTGIKDLTGNTMEFDYVFTFRTAYEVIVDVPVVVPPVIPPVLPLNPTAPVMGESGRFVILAYSAISTTGVTAISNGDIGVTPAARTFMTGFTPLGSEGAYVELSSGMSYAPEDANPAPFPYPLHYSTPVVGAAWTTTGAMLTQALADLNIAYSFLAADPNPSAPTQVCPIELGGQLLTRGVYKTASDVTIQTGDITLDAQGDPNSVFIFTIDGTLTTGAPGGNIVLINGALAKNVYFRTSGITVIGSATTFYGNVFSWTQINVLNGAQITGSLYAVTEQVTLIGDTITK